MPDYPKAVISTSLGDMTVELWTDVAPNHVENFLKLGSSGFYNNLTFHRILPGFRNRLLRRGVCHRAGPSLGLSMDLRFVDPMG